VNVLRDVVVPVASAYAVLASVVLYAARHPDAGRPVDAPSGWRSRLRLIGVTVTGGYVVFLGIVVVYHTWLVGQPGALRSALHGGTFVALACTAVFLAGSVLEARFGRRSA
jgi:hypothetical protein